MARKEFYIEKYPEISGERAFTRLFQQQILLLLKKRGKLTETQYRRAAALLERDKP